MRRTVRTILAAAAVTGGLLTAAPVAIAVPSSSRVAQPQTTATTSNTPATAETADSKGKPPAKVTDLRAAQRTSSSITLTWKLPKTNAPASLAVRNLKGTTAPTAKQGTLADYVSGGTTHVTVTSLSPSTEYSFSVFSIGSGKRVSQPAKLTTATQAAGTISDAQVVSTTDDTITISWKNPTESDFDGVMIRRLEGSAAPSSTTDGTDAGFVTPDGDSFVDDSVSPDTEYSYALFTEVNHAYATPVQVGARTQQPSGPPPAPVTNLKAQPTDNLAVDLSWTDPAGSISGIMIRRNVGDNPPSSDSAGTLIASLGGTATAYSDQGLSGDTDYSYSVFTQSSLGQTSVPASATATVPDASGSVQECGEIEGSVTWSPASAAQYVLTCETSVAVGSTLTIEPGTVIKGEQEGGLQVEGVLDVDGTTANPAVFTSYNDNSVGVPDGDGGPEAGDWLGIFGSGADLDITGARIEYGGGASVGFANAGASVSLSAGALTMTDSTVEFSGTSGVWADSNSAVDLEDNTISHCDGTGIRVTTGSDPTEITPTVTGNTVTATSGAAIVLTAAMLDPTKLGGNTGSADAPTALEVTGNLDGDLTLPVAGLPWVVGPAEAGSYSDYDGDDLTIDAGSSLTLGNGAVLKVAGDPYPTNAASEIDVEGTLTSTATAVDPATITSLFDDSAGGDLNADGDATEPAAGNWAGISARGNAGSSTPVVDLSNVTVAYAGSDSNGCIDAGGTTELTLTSDTIEHCDGAGVSLETDVGGSVDVSDSTVTDADTGIELSQAAGDPVTVEDNTFDDTGIAMDLASSAIDPATLTGNSAAGTGVQAIEASGNLIDNLSLPQPAGDLAWAIGNRDVCVYTSPCNGPGLTINSGTTLAMGPGAVLKAVYIPKSTIYTDLYNSPLTVEGTLDVEGSAADPATLTSIRDDSVGGDTNGDGTDAPQPGDWGGIATNTDGTTQPVITLNHAVVSYAQQVASNSANADVTIENSTIEDMAAAYSAPAVDLTSAEAASYVVENNQVNNITGDGILVGPSYDFNDPNPTAPVSPIVSGNSVTDVTGFAISVDSPALDAADLVDNTGSSDGQDTLSLGGTLTTNLTLPMAGLAVTIEDAYGNDGLTVASGTTLTLEAGEVLKIAADLYEPGINVGGSLISEGTTDDPVIITSLTDDSVGGDTNGDGAATKPGAGDWGGIAAGSEPGDPAPVVDLTDTDVRYSEGISTAGTTHLTMTGDELTDTARSAVRATFTSGGYADIESTSIQRVTNGDGIDITTTSTRAVDAPILRNDDVEDATDAAFDIAAADLVPANLTGDTATNDFPNAIEVSGTLAANLTLPLSGLPLVVAAPPGSQSNQQVPAFGLTVPAGITLTMDPDAVLKFAPFSDYDGPTVGQLIVSGTLISQATSSDPASFTSIADDSVGGDTNGDGDGSVALTGDWAGIVSLPVAQRPAPVIDLPNTSIQYAQTALSMPSGNATVTGTIKNDSFGVAGPPEDAQGNCSNGTVTATPVDWGTPSGPAPYGSGPGVSGCVTVMPWVGES